MKQALREMLGKAGHARMVRFFDEKELLAWMLPVEEQTWEGLSEETKELYCCEAEAIVMAFMQQLVNDVRSEQEYQEAMELIQAKEHQEEPIEEGDDA